MKTKLNQLPDMTLGIDLGITSIITDSDGNKVDSPKYLKKSLDKLGINQKVLSRKKSKSINRSKQRIIVAKTYEQITNKRNDFLHKLSHKLAYDNQITNYAIEDLNVKGMIKNKRLSRSINDCGWHKFITLLKYKCKDLGKNVLKIDRFAPSSKICNCCGYKLSKLPLKIRNWKCPQCNEIHDRDINVAKNIKAFALADTLGTRYV